MKRCIIAILCVILLAFGCLAAEKHELSGSLEDGVRVVEVTASKYKFSPDPIVVRVGQKVRLNITTSDVVHGLAISQFSVNAVIRPKETARVEFTADKEGSFTVFCSVYCGPGHSHMHGTLIVLK